MKREMKQEDQGAPSAQSKASHLESALRKAQAKCDKTMERRMALPPGSTRARVTTANAHWMRACEARDRIQQQIEAANAD